MVQQEVDIALMQLKEIQGKLFLHSFLELYKAVTTRTVLRRSLERHETVKHHMEVLLEQFRNICEVGARAQIQEYMARTETIITRFRFSIINCTQSI